MKKILFLFLAVVMYSMNTYAQDDCATAVALPNLMGGGTHSETGTAVNAGTAGGVGGGAGTYSASWFSFTPTQGGLIDVSACLGGSDTRVYIHDNCAGPAIANNDDACPFAPDGTGSAYASEVTGVGVVGGTTYYIEWDDRWDVGPFDWSITYTPLDPADCATLDAPADGATDQPTSVDLTWTAAATGGAATSYDVYFGTDPAALAMVSNEAGTTYNTGALMAGTTYYWYVNPINVSGTTDCSATVYSFTVAAVVCDPPTTVAASAVSADGATITWVDGPGCLTDQIVTITPAVAGSPFSVPCGTQTLDLAGLLMPSTTYTVDVTNNCGSMPMASAMFATNIINSDCASAIALPNLMGGGTHMEMGTSITPGAPGGVGSAGAYSAAWFSFTPAEDGTINVNSCLGGSDTRVWIHDNCAGPSIAGNDDACAFAPDGTGSTFASEVDGVAVTSGTTYYIEWDDRWNAGPFNWSITFTPPCNGAPTNAAVEIGTDPTTATISWDAMPGTDLYQVKYRERDGDGTWLKFGTAFTQRVVTGLDPNKQYQYKIRRRCAAGGWSDYTPITNFPLFYTSNCPTPTGVSSIYLDDTRFKVRWDDMGQVKGRVRYREVGTTTWSIKYGLPGNNYAYITGLTPGADYEYRVRVNCNDNEWSPYLNVLFFHSLSGAGARVNQLEGVQVFPNPVSDVLNISYANELGSEMTVEVFDMLGRAVVSEISNDNRVALNVNGLNNGTYVVTVTVDGEQHIEKFIKR